MGTIDSKENTIDFKGKLVLEVSDKPRKDEFGEKSYFLKIDFSATNGAESNNELFKLMSSKISKIEINSAIHGQHTLNTLLNPNENPVGQQIPHVSLGWFGAFHEQNLPGRPFDQEVIRRAEEAVAQQDITDFSFTLNLNEFTIVSAFLQEDEIIKDETIKFSSTKGMGDKRDTTIVYQVPEPVRTTLINIAKKIFGENFKQTDNHGKPVEFHITAAQTNLKASLKAVIPFTPAKDSQEQKATESIAPSSKNDESPQQPILPTNSVSIKLT